MDADNNEQARGSMSQSACVCRQRECMRTHACSLGSVLQGCFNIDADTESQKTLTLVRKARLFPASKRLSKLGDKEGVHVV